MAEPTVSEIQDLFNRVVTVMEGKPGNLQLAVLSNLIAAFSCSAMRTGGDPYDVARNIYRNSKLHIANNLKGQGLLTSLPKGATRQ